QTPLITAIQVRGMSRCGQLVKACNVALQSNNTYLQVGLRFEKMSKEKPHRVMGQGEQDCSVVTREGRPILNHMRVGRCRTSVCQIAMCRRPCRNTGCDRSEHTRQPDRRTHHLGNPCSNLLIGRVGWGELE